MARVPLNFDETKPNIKERLKALGNLPAFLREVYLTSPALTISNTILRLLRSAIPISILYIGKLIIDEVLVLSSTKSDNLNQIYLLIAAEFGLMIISDLLSRGIALTDSLLGDLFANRTSIKLMKHAVSLDLAQFENATFYDKLERARQQTNGRTALLSQILAQGQDAITMGLLLVGLVTFNPWLIVLLLVSVIPSFIGEWHFNAKSYSLQRGWTPQRRELDYYRFIGASDETAKEVKLFGLSDFIIERFKSLSDRYFKENKKLAIERASWGSLLVAIGTLGYFGAYTLIIVDTVKGIVTIGSLTFLAGSFRQLKSLLEGILGRFTSISQGALYLNDLFEFYQIEPQIVSPVQAKPFPSPIREGFNFENVGFKYPNSDKWANRNLNFVLKVGEKLALVGENGSGKTTLVKLLARLYDPDEGRILLDGVDLKDYNLVELREHIGVIFQDFQKFNFTAGDNIAVGDIESREELPELERAAHQSLADTVIEKLPLKYDQPLGRKFSKGIELSGGEWQKVALARAYLREAEVLILDEPTAALDARAEYEVFRRFAELTKGKTAILISHRFSTVRMADRILVLDKGNLLEIGTHEELLEKNGRYAELFYLQAEGYK
ncbi:ABC transporter ATP-binding protein [Emticicia aquatilis]|uniref:ABC transporter ATP-binding protein n=1 Tax=Emticicia aquatilis TaxID=1537369 RepID=A0A917DRL3_9BACT|nr:ABC transporter ATP-binding protein [Emticicia aquatilis]GGD60008.1 ABC transporter ATP-binding protein [Emticicia aquatilis]